MAKANTGAAVDAEALILKLIEEAGQAQERMAAARKVYDAKREALAAMLLKHRGEGVEVEAGGFVAVIARRVENYIDPQRLHAALRGKLRDFFALVTVPLGAAKAALTAETFAELQQARTARTPTLTVRRAKAGGE